MKKVYLHGQLGELFGPSYEFDIPNPQMGISALCSQVKGFKELFRTGQWIVIMGDQQNGLCLGEDELLLQFGKETEMHIIPYISGSGGRGGGVAQVVYGTLKVIGGLVAAPFSMGASLFLVGSGLGIIASGINQLSASRPDVTPDTYENREAPDQKPSFLFSGPTNTTQQGLPVQIIYGRMRVGSQVISSGLTTEVV